MENKQETSNFNSEKLQDTDASFEEFNKFLSSLGSDASVREKEKPANGSDSGRNAKLSFPDTNEFLSEKATKTDIIRKNAIKGSNYEKKVFEKLNKQDFVGSWPYQVKEQSAEGATRLDTYLWKKNTDSKIPFKEAAMIEIKSGEHKNYEQTIKQLSLAKEKEIPLIFLVPEGKKSYNDKFSEQVKNAIESSPVPVYIADINNLDEAVHINSEKQNNVRFPEDWKWD